MMPARSPPSMGWCGDPIAAPQIAPLSSLAPNCIGTVRLGVDGS